MHFIKIIIMKLLKILSETSEYSIFGKESNIFGSGVITDHSVAVTAFGFIAAFECMWQQSLSLDIEFKFG